MKSLSIIIPVYNTEQYLEECLDSILDQDVDFDVEVICVNDDSPDNSLDILERYADKHSDTIKVLNQSNTGGATAINNGIRLARGEYILIVDSDDYLLPDSINKLVGRAKATGADLVVGKLSKLSGSTFSPVEETNWIHSSELLTTPTEKSPLFISKFYHGKLIAKGLLDSESILMKDGQLYADGPFVSRIYIASQVVATLDFEVSVWRKREDTDSQSITDRKRELKTLQDHMESLQMSLDTTRSANEPCYLVKLVEYDSRRPVWHLFPAWASGHFSFPQLSEFYEETSSYYSDIASIEIRNLPRAEGLLVRSLLTKSKMKFYFFSFLYFGRTQYRVYRGKFAQGLRRSRLKKTLKRTVSALTPMYVKRKLRTILPNYVGHETYRVMLKSLDTDPEMVVFESFFGKSYSGNPKYIYEALVRKSPGYRCVWVYSAKPHDIPDCYKQVRRGSDEYFENLARAKYWVNNIQFPVHEKGNDTVYLQTWHGTPLKKLGWDISVSGPEAEAREKAYRESRCWDFLLSQNSYSSEIFRRCFRYPGEILEYGYPINDIFRSPERAATEAELRKQLGIGVDKRVVLYAPTWRDNNPIGNWVFEADDVFDYQRWSKEVPEDVVLLLKFHHLVKPPALDQHSGKIISVSNQGDTQELLAIADCLITDYSSIFFDYLNTHGSIIFYAYDLEQYQSSTRDMYLSMEELPGPVITDFEQLIELVQELPEVERNYFNARQLFRERFCPRDDGAAADRIVNRIFPGLASDKQRKQASA